MKNCGGIKMSKYTPATFQPTVRPDWAGILSYLSDKEKSEILTALFKYPSDISEKCESAFWKETIKPDLDLQYQVFTESCKAKSRGVRNRWDKISITDVEDMNNTSIRYDIDTEREREKEKKSEEEKIGGVGEKEKPTLEEVLEYAREQNMFAGAGGFACTDEQAEEFWSYYESQGWRIGNDSNTPIRDWQPKLRQWCIKAKRIPTNQFGQRVVKMTAKEIKEAENHIKLQKMLKGEL